MTSAAPRVTFVLGGSSILFTEGTSRLWGLDAISSGKERSRAADSFVFSHSFIGRKAFWVARVSAPVAMVCCCLQSTSTEETGMCPVHNLSHKSDKSTSGCVITIAQMIKATFTSLPSSSPLYLAKKGISRPRGQEGCHKPTVGSNAITFSAFP
ncbi:unnamed protein product [Arctogadus glacialis]